MAAAAVEVGAVAAVAAAPLPDQLQHLLPPPLPPPCPRPLARVEGVAAGPVDHLGCRNASSWLLRGAAGRQGCVAMWATSNWSESAMQQ